jgi:predicted nucleotidyltransferase
MAYADPHAMGSDRRLRLPEHRAVVAELVARLPDLTLQAGHGISVAIGTLWRFLKSAEHQPALDPGRLVFIDETCATTNMVRCYGRAARGLGLLAPVPHGWSRIDLDDVRAIDPGLCKFKLKEISPRLRSNWVWRVKNDRIWPTDRESCIHGPRRRSAGQRSRSRARARTIEPVPLAERRRRPGHAEQGALMNCGEMPSRSLPLIVFNSICATMTGMHVSDDPILKRFRAALDEMYGERLERVMLFGSRARGDARPDSDYDVAVFLKDLKAGDLANRWRELDRLADLRSKILYETDVFIDAKTYHAAAYRDRTSLMREIRRDGVDL